MRSIGLSSCFLLLFITTAFGGAALAADMTREQVSDALAHATADQPADFAGKSLEKLDLTKLNFTGAKLAGANLFGANLMDADFTGADLSGATLDLAWLMRTNFTRANLTHASIQGPVVAMGMETSAAQAPILPEADLSGARIVARLNWANMQGAKFVDARMGADMKNQSMGLMRVDMSSANLAGADFTGADLFHASMRFTKLMGANLAGARLALADLSGADLTGADLTGADVSDADFTQAVLTGAKGLDQMKGKPLNLPGQ
ncbi:MAG TPA: pentapeptide repeat-containing protein [Verrucomicrobiae bacterium]|nr:pentapeptide repeat-containing protein [Verrucomicrobiae bacterium]